MEIKVFREFYYAQRRGLIRCPKGLKLDDELLEDKYLFTHWIANFLNGKSDFDYESLLKKNGDLSGKGTIEDPYFINTNFGCGNFLHFSTFLGEDDDFSCFKKRFCFQNVFEFAKSKDQKSEILSGIAFRDFPFLHSVVLVDDYVLDFNYDLAMGKDLYFKMFNFEVLTKVDSDYVKENAYLINKDSKFLIANRIAYGDVAFCFEELVEILKQEKRCEEIVL